MSTRSRWERYDVLKNVQSPEAGKLAQYVPKLVHV